LKKVASMMDNSRVLIALPTYNEEEAIELMLERIIKLQILVIVVDAGSTDKTVALAQKWNVPVYDRKEYGRGYGCGILKAIDIASKENYEWLLVLDSDMTYPPEEIPRLIELSKDFDMVIGTRPMNDISFWRRLANNIHTQFASVLFGKEILDINSGMRMIRINKFKGHLSERNMGMIPQISSFAMRNNLRIQEVPIKYEKRIGNSKSDIIDGIVILWCILRERFRSKVY